MWKFVLKRLALGALTVLLISFFMFLLLELLPQKPWDQMLHNPRLSDADRQRILQRFGADQGFLVQYWTFLKNITKPFWTWIVGQGFQGPDFGDAVALNSIPVTQAIMEKVPNTLVLMVTSYIVQLLIAIPIGVISAVRQYGKLDNFVTAFSFFGISLPNFWLGAMLIFIFAIPHSAGATGLLPVGGTPELTDIPQLISHLIMPVIVLAVQGIAVYARYTRSAMLDVLNQDYIRTAKAKGLPERRIIIRHAFRNSLLPLITLVGIDMPTLFVGAVITENVFNWDGLGRRFVLEAEQNDVNFLLGVLIILSILVVIGNLIADLVYTWADPRISYSGAH